jgi:hypothetical protein
MRGTDFSLRVTLLVQGWHKTGLTILDAATKTAEYPFVDARLGKSSRGRRSSWEDAEPAKDDTVRQFYYAFRRNHRNLDELLDAWYAAYLEWCAWVIAASERTLDHVVAKYERRGQTENAKEFRLFARRIRKNPLQQARNRELLSQAELAARSRIDSDHWDPRANLPPCQYQSLATDFWNLARLQAHKGERTQAQDCLERSVEVWRTYGHDVPARQAKAIDALQTEIANLATYV